MLYLLGVLKYLIQQQILQVQGTWLEKKDQTYLSEYTDRLTGTEGDLTSQDVTGFPKYYAMFGGATGLTDTTSGGLYVAPTPDAAYNLEYIIINKQQGYQQANTTTYLSNYFPQGLLYACLVRSIFFFKRSNGDVDTI